MTPADVDTTDRVRRVLDAPGGHGALLRLVARVDRYIKAVLVVRSLSTPGHAFARQGGHANQSHRDEWATALAERDATERELRAVVEARDGKAIT